MFKQILTFALKNFLYRHHHLRVINLTNAYITSSLWILLTAVVSLFYSLTKQMNTLVRSSKIGPDNSHTAFVHRSRRTNIKTKLPCCSFEQM